MGDYFQTIVDLDASAADAERLARRVVDRLVTEGIVLAERTDCVLGRPLGHPPGPSWARAVGDLDADEEPWDGLAVHIGRTVFDGGQDSPEAVTCPLCAATTPLESDPYDEFLPEPDGRSTAATDAEDPWPRFATALATWQTTGDAMVVCPACRCPAPLPDWTWTDDRLALGHLGFEFWNWPELTDDFRTRLSGLLDGHRTAYVWGKI
ncbi:hypothetical protein ACFV16_03465 [Streptomyces massasporeus]|uniref:hypothetical protein n=1 Tax=Streptomyces massasporeus TaxID=67324 RepID=UPI00367DBBA7